MKEIWKKIKEYPLYEVSTMGRFRSWNNFRTSQNYPLILKLINQGNGYKLVYFYKNRKPKRILCHRAVLEAFSPSPDKNLICRHRNNNRSDNRLSNLEWGTYKDNANDRHRHGTMIYGSKTSTAKLNENKVRKIKQLIKDGLGNTVIGNMFGVSHCTIYCIRYGKTWNRVQLKT